MDSTKQSSVCRLARLNKDCIVAINSMAVSI